MSIVAMAGTLELLSEVEWFLLYYCSVVKLQMREGMEQDKINAAWSQEYIWKEPGKIL